MKKLALAIIVLVVLGTVGCYAQKTKGNGNIITKEIQIADYSGLIVGQGIEINGSFFSGKINLHKLIIPSRMENPV